MTLIRNVFIVVSIIFLIGACQRGFVQSVPDGQGGLIRGGAKAYFVYMQPHVERCRAQPGGNLVCKKMVVNGL